VHARHAGVAGGRGMLRPRPHLGREAAVRLLQQLLQFGRLHLPDQVIATLGIKKLRAKIRTGGVTRDDFPQTRDIIRFVRTCMAANVPFKATAGLHHAVRGEYRLTYEPVPPTGVMFGFLNVALAAALLWFGRDDDIVLAALEERSPASIELTDAGVSWRNERLTIAQLDEVRSEFFVGFGSCSFREPMAEIGLEALPRA